MAATGEHLAVPAPDQKRDTTRHEGRAVRKEPPPNQRPQEKISRSGNNPLTLIDFQNMLLLKTRLREVGF